MNYTKVLSMKSQSNSYMRRSRRPHSHQSKRNQSLLRNSDNQSSRRKSHRLRSLLSNNNPFLLNRLSTNICTHHRNLEIFKVLTCSNLSLVNILHSANNNLYWFKNVIWKDALTLPTITLRRDWVPRSRDYSHTTRTLTTNHYDLFFSHFNINFL